MKEKIGNAIEEHARKLKEEVGTALSGDECLSLINDAVTEALELVKDNSVLGGVVGCEHRNEDLIEVTDKIIKCKCGETIAR